MFSFTSEFVAFECVRFKGDRTLFSLEVAKETIAVSERIRSFATSNNLCTSPTINLEVINCF